MVHLLVSPNLGPRAYFLGFQGSQPGLEPGLSTAEVCHHGLHLLAGFLVQHVHLPRVLSLLVLLQQPAVGGSIAGPAHALGTDLWRTGVFSLSARPGLETVDGGGGNESEVRTPWKETWGVWDKPGLWGPFSASPTHPSILRRNLFIS